ncbi:YegS/Rv2252/BmrU family lipid kinase [Corynebacterium freiburgense]|uniref:YegS/Rv2252/BmrU family lipid kinase n=1 Tax=Corynebacterium freiburgense TaxID=556548 RepID=UPI000420A0D6|nr:YegS/Rv2252/BmrU family lipid kinase [Corynebacterium freiburgense]WJZ03676.1 Diacylglycerol kinase [Corynebacterium freiburgense]
MLKKIALLTNPTAGRGTAVAASEAARKRFAELGVEVLSISGSSWDESMEKAEQVLQEDIDALVACGGDGILNLALQKQVHSGVPLGIIPAGTGNDFARSFGIPSDPVKAAEIVAQGTTKQTDIGQLRSVNDQTRSMYFGTIACQGFDSLVNERTNALKWPTGAARYTVASFIEIATFHSIPTRIFVDDQKEPMELDTTLIAVGNTNTYGGGSFICPNADPTDGLFDVTIIRGMSKLQAIGKLATYFKGEKHEDPEVISLRAKKIRIEMEGNIPSFADGERFGLTPVEAEILPGAGLYLVP